MALVPIGAGTVPRLSPEMLEIIKENPSCLTKEGVQHKLWLMELSANKYLKYGYLVMLKQCRRLKPSKVEVRKVENKLTGEEEDVKCILLSYYRDDEPRNWITEENYEKLRKEVQQKMQRTRK